MPGTYELLKNDKGDFRFNLRAGNNQIILSSEDYPTKAGAEGGINSVKRNSGLEERYERKVAKDSSPYFTMKAANGEIIGKSEMYSSDSARDNGIASVKVNGPTAPIKDLTA
jgi:uncharacterized protein YegP (UPF0339 family)